MTEEKLEKWYDKKYFDSYPKHDRRIGQILENIDFSLSDNVCEFGCGLGHILMAISGQISKGTGIDVSEYATGKAADSATTAGIHNLDFTSIDILSLKENDRYRQAFDKVLMMDISEHLYDDTLSGFFESASHVLRPGGELILHTPNAGYYLEIMKARNFILKQFESHIAVRNLQQHIPLLEKNGFLLSRIKYLPHYNRYLGIVDRILMHIPLVNRFFRARLLIIATKKT